MGDKFDEMAKRAECFIERTITGSPGKIVHSTFLDRVKLAAYLREQFTVEDLTLRNLINRIYSICNVSTYEPKTDSRVGDCMGLVNVFMHSREQAAMIRALELAKIRTLSRYGVDATFDELDVMIAEIKAGM